MLTVTVKVRLWVSVDNSVHGWWGILWFRELPLKVSTSVLSPLQDLILSMNARTRMEALAADSWLVADRLGLVLVAVVAQN